MINIDDFFESSPLEKIEREEYGNILVKFCAFVCILKNKKMNFPSIFVHILSEPEYFEAYKKVCGFDNNVEAVREFLAFDESIVKSKFLRRVINKENLIQNDG